MGFLSILSFIWKGIGSFIGKIVGGVVTVVKDYPIPSIAVVVLLAACWFSYHLGVVRTTRILTEEHAAYVKQVEDEAKGRDTRIAALESESKARADALTTKDLEKQKALDTAKATYTANLAKAIKAEKVVVVRVPVPGLKDPQEVMVDNGKLACRRLPSTFTDQVNSLVTISNKGSAK